MFHAVSPCGLLSSVSPSGFQFGRCFVLFGSAMQTPLFSSGRYWLAMDGSDISSTPTSSDSVDLDEHKIWNPVLELPFHVHVGVFMVAYFDELDLKRIALSCHFALGILCDKAEVHCPDECSIRHHSPW